MIMDGPIDIIEQTDVHHLNKNAALLSGIAGTAAMTALVYSAPIIGLPKMNVLGMLSKFIDNIKEKTKDIFNPHLKERLCDVLMEDLNSPLDHHKHLFAASIVHLGVGIIFSFSYAWLWSKGIGKPDTPNGIILGAICGGIAVLVWKLVINTNPQLPKLSFWHLIADLLPGHILLGVTAQKIYKDVEI